MRQIEAVSMRRPLFLRYIGKDQQRYSDLRLLTGLAIAARNAW
jgi:hypothetical protein